jgi:hypothetical protein
VRARPSRSSAPPEQETSSRTFASRIPALTGCAGFGHVAPLPAGSIHRDVATLLDQLADFFFRGVDFFVLAKLAE